MVEQQAKRLTVNKHAYIPGLDSSLVDAHQNMFNTCEPAKKHASRLLGDWGREVSDLEGPRVVGGSQGIIYCRERL